MALRAIKPMAIRDILNDLNLSHLVANFDREKITTAVIPALTDDQLINLGVRTVGDRHRLRTQCRSTGSILSRFMPAKHGPYTKKSRKSKTTSWTRKVVCLADPATNMTPRMQEKQTLIDAGMGEKIVTVPDIAITPEEFQTVLLNYFPKLKDAGGFEMLTCVGNERKLVPIKGQYSPNNLKERLGQSRIYIRPIQHALDMDPVCEVVNEDSGMCQKCCICQKYISFNVLKKHLESCISSRSSPPSSTVTVPPSSTPSSTVTVPPSSVTVLPEQQAPSTSSHVPSVSEVLTNNETAYQSYVNLCESDEEDTDFMLAINNSLADAHKSCDETKDVSFRELICQYQSHCSDDTQTIIVNRRRLLSSVLFAARNKDFVWEKQIDVEFAGEEAVDVGGPKREMLRLLMKAIATEMGIFEGRPGHLYFTHDIALLEKKQYRMAGKLVAWSVLHGGPGLPVLATDLYHLMCGLDLPSKLNDHELVTDYDAQQKLCKISSCSSAEEYVGISKELGDWAADQGVPELYSGDFSRKDHVLASLLKQHILYRTQAEILQFQEGLGRLWTMISDFPTQFKGLFVNDGATFTRLQLKSLLSVNFSEEGSNLFSEETDTVYCWEVFVKDCEDGKTRTTLSDILIFVTGADAIPPLGFPDAIQINFFTRLPNLKGHPTASTCALELHLPRGLQDPLEFRILMEEAIINGKGFGKI